MSLMPPPVDPVEVERQRVVEEARQAENRRIDAESRAGQARYEAEIAASQLPIRPVREGFPMPNRDTQWTHSSFGGNQIDSRVSQSLSGTTEATNSTRPGETSLALTATSIALDSVPIVGSAKSVIQLFTGTDLVTGEKINRWEEAAGIGLGLVGAKALTKVDDVWRLGKAASRHLDDVARTADSVAPAINPRLMERAEKWRTYKGGGGQADMRAWVKATQGQKWGTGGKSGFAKWSRSVDSPHGNSLMSRRTNYLYEKFDSDGNFQKWGITDNMATRYSGAQAKDTRLFEYARGSRSEMAKLERTLEETQPGPLNLQPWARSAWKNGLGRVR
jgi:Pre-toxin TG